jgi:DNA-binding response OmpR family regulator
VVAVVPAEADIADEVTRHKADLVILAPNGEDEEVPAFASRTMNCLKEASNGTRPSVIFLRPRVCNGGLSAYHIGADVYLFERFHPLELVAFVRRFIGSPKG